MVSRVAALTSAQMAGDVMTGRHLPQLRRFGPTAVEHVRTARVEAAAGRRLDRARHVARKDDARAPDRRVGVGHRHGRQQRFGVGMLRIGKQRAARRELDDAAEIHHRDAMADVLDDREVVRDEEIGQAELRLQIHEQVDDLRLHRHVERRDRLVADDHLGLDGERARDPEALALSAGEFVRILPHLVGPQADAREQPGDALGPLFARRDVVVVQRLADDLARAHARIERRIGILKDHLQAASTRAHRGAVESRDVLAFQRDRAARRFDQAQDRLSGRRLAAAALADEAQRLARREVERHAVDRLHLADLAREQSAAHRVVLDQRLDFEHGSRAVDGSGTDHLRQRIGVPARDEMARRGFDLRRIGDAALLGRVGAARRERAASRHVDQRRHHARDLRQATGPARTRPARD